MHDIDRALFEGEDEGGTWGEVSNEQTGYSQETGTYEYQENESAAYEGRGSLDEVWGEALSSESDELSQASELLAVNNEEELDRFLGDLVSNAVSATRSFANSGAGQAMGNLLKSSARKILPQLGRAIGDYVAPGLGGQAGAQAGTWLGTKFETGLQLEGLSAEDRELETARAFVRFANSAARRAASTPPNVPGAVAARQAATAAARQYLPGLLRVTSTPGGPALSGRWVRRGRNIVILGAL